MAGRRGLEWYLMTTDEVLAGTKAVAFDRALRVAHAIDLHFGTRLSVLKPEARLPLLRLRVLALAYHVTVTLVVEIIRAKYARRDARGLGLPLANLTGDAAFAHARATLKTFAKPFTACGKISRMDDADGYAAQVATARARAVVRPYRTNPWTAA